MCVQAVRDIRDAVDVDVNADGIATITWDAVLPIVERFAAAAIEAARQQQNARVFAGIGADTPPTELKFCRDLARKLVAECGPLQGPELFQVLRRERAAARAEGIAQERLNKVGYAFQDRYDRLAAAAKQAREIAAGGAGSIHSDQAFEEIADVLDAALETEGT